MRGGVGGLGGLGLFYLLSKVNLPPSSIPSNKNLNERLSNARRSEQDLLVHKLLLLITRRKRASDHNSQYLKRG